MNRRMVLVASFVLLEAGGAAFAADKPRSDLPSAIVAPLTVASAQTEDSLLGESLAETIAISLAQSGTVAVVDFRRLREVLAEQKLADDGLTDLATTLSIGRQLNAKWTVTGSLGIAGNNIRAAVVFTSVETQQTVGAVQVEGARQELDRLAFELAQKAARIAGVEATIPAAKDIDESPIGRVHLMRGIAMYHSQNYEQSIICCLQAIRRDPRLLEARLWIARSYLKMGEFDHARVELATLRRQSLGPLEPQVKELLSTIPESSPDSR